jgi:hypothetical protein
VFVCQQSSFTCYWSETKYLRQMNTKDEEGKGKKAQRFVSMVEEERPYRRLVGSFFRRRPHTSTTHSLHIVLYPWYLLQYTLRLVAVIEKSFEMIRYMGDTVLKMGFTFDQINDMFTSN